MRILDEQFLRTGTKRVAILSSLERCAACHLQKDLSITEQNTVLAPDIFLILAKKILQHARSSHRKRLLEYLDLRFYKL